MIFDEFIAKKIQKTFEKHLNEKILTIKNMEKTIEELKLILLEADVNYNLIEELTNNIINKSKNEFIQEGLNKKEMLIKIIYNELTKIMSTKNMELNLNNTPTTIILIGLPGSGKTLTTAKLANMLKNKYNKKCLLVAGDIYRPGAIEQLILLGKKINVEVFSQKNKNIFQIIKNAKIYANKQKIDIILIDTAGRLQINKKLMKELSEIKKITSPQEVLIVCDSLSGQNMINVIINFNKKIPITGSIITKLDGTSKAGIAISISYLTKIPIKFLGTGEKINDLDPFYPNRMTKRILGMGDINTLIEKAENVISKRNIKKTMDRMLLGQFDLNDLINQMKQIKKLGKLELIIKMIPGTINKIDDNEINNIENNLKISEYIINSTTNQERKNPKIINNPNRKKRILNGSGRSEKEFNKMLEQFEKIKKIMNEINWQIKNGKIPDISLLKELIKK